MSRRERLLTALETLQPQHLEVQDESHTHSRGAETHFKAVIVSEVFADLNLLRRHQRVYAVLGELMQQIHALALFTYTPEEWARTTAAPDSPACRGGSLHDR